MTKKNATKKVVDEKTSKKLTKEDLQEVIDEVRQETKWEDDEVRQATQLEEDEVLKATSVKRIYEEFLNTAEAMILSGFKHGQSEDTIKTDLFTAGISEGITFSQIQKIYKKITINQGLVKTAKEVKTNIQNYLEEMKFKETVSAWGLNEPLDYNKFLPTIDRILFEIRGATERRVVSVMKKNLTEMNMEMPNKPKRKKLSKNERIFITIINTFFNNSRTSEEEFKTIMESITNVKTAKKWCDMYEIFSYIALRMEKAE
jgi:hypothetical protein